MIRNKTPYNIALQNNTKSLPVAESTLFIDEKAHIVCSAASFYNKLHEEEEFTAHSKPETIDIVEFTAHSEPETIDIEELTAHSEPETIDIEELTAHSEPETIDFDACSELTWKL